MNTEKIMDHGILEVPIPFKSNCPSLRHGIFTPSPVVWRTPPIWLPCCLVEVHAQVVDNGVDHHDLTQPVTTQKTNGALEPLDSMPYNFPVVVNEVSMTFPRNLGNMDRIWLTRRRRRNK